MEQTQNMQTRKCWRCDTEKQLNEENFRNVKSENSGFEYECKVCVSKRMKELRNPNDPKDYIGSDYPLTYFKIIEDLGKVGDHKKYIVACKCGSPPKIVRYHALKSGSTRSCAGKYCPYAGRKSACKTQRTSSLLIDDDQTRFQLTKGAFEKIQNSAAARGIHFNLKPQDVLEKFKQNNGRETRWTGLPINGSAIRDSKTDWSLDRINSDKTIGYVPDNIDITLKFTNILKNRYNEHPLKLWVAHTWNNMPPEEQQHYLQCMKDPQACKKEFAEELKKVYKNGKSFDTTRQNRYGKKKAETQTDEEVEIGSQAYD